MFTICVSPYDFKYFSEPIISKSFLTLEKATFKRLIHNIACQLACDMISQFFYSGKLENGESIYHLVRIRPVFSVQIRRMDTVSKQALHILLMHDERQNA